MNSRPGPLGATIIEGGVNFALFSRYARAVQLCLYDGKFDARPSRVIDLAERTNEIWHTFIPGIGRGQLYGYRVDGPYDPPSGQRFNKHKLLTDPYAKAITHKHDWHDQLHFAYDKRSTDLDLAIDRRDNDRLAPKCVVLDDGFDWQGVEKPAIPPDRLVIEEVHLKGFTAHPSSGVAMPGTYLGFIEKIPHLKDLGINAVELLPIHETGSEHHLFLRGLTNYWGYATLGFFAPDSRFASGQEPGAQVKEFKTLVRELHRAGIEVILDVVYNHTCEGSHIGPTFCFRGIDNASYYKLDPNNPRLYWDVTGCGNTLNADHPRVVQLIMDSLRYWAGECRVDGFRFDLATTLGRAPADFTNRAPIFVAMQQDPALQAVKLIAEPWDLGMGGYQIGNFPVGFHEWNGRFRDNIRGFVRGDGGQLSDLGFSITGSSNLFGDDGRHPYHSVNFITTHDGFTMQDLVSYNRKHNEANQEGNRDGENNNFSFNWGVEGPSGDPAILALRRKAMKNYLAILFLSQGAPMITAGDEFAKTQSGNNNAYCQDNETSWLDYSLKEKNEDLYQFCKSLIAFRQNHSALRRKEFFKGKCPFGEGFDIAWFGTDGKEMDWRNPDGKFIACLLDGRCVEARHVNADADLLMLFNMNGNSVDFPLPTPPQGGSWSRVLDTSLPHPFDFNNESSLTPISPLTKSFMVTDRGIVLFMGIL